MILATGGMGLVRAAYSAGKPAYGVGPGNAPVLHRAIGRRREGRRRHHHRQDVRQRRALLVAELGRRRRGGRRRGEARSSWRRAAISCRRPKPTRSRSVLVTPQRLPNPALVGKSATFIARAGRHHGARRHARADRGARRASAATIRCRSRSSARCSRITSSSDWREGCERCKQILRYGGMGHTMSIHSRNEQVILRVRPEEAGVPHRRQHADDARIDRPDDRPRSGDDARLRRLRRQHHVRQHLAAAPAQHQAARLRDSAGTSGHRCARCRRCRQVPQVRQARRASGHALPQAPAKPDAGADCRPTTLTGRIDAFLASRGIAGTRTAGTARRARPHPHLRQPRICRRAGDVRLRRRCAQAVKSGRKILDRRADDRHPGRARCGRSGQGLRLGGLAVA